MDVTKKIDRLLEAKTITVKQSPYFKSILKDKDMKKTFDTLEKALKGIATKKETSFLISATNIEGVPYVDLGDVSMPDKDMLKDIEKSIKKMGFTVNNKSYDKKAKKFRISFGDKIRV